MSERYWLVHSNGGRQLIDPAQFDLERLAEQARQVGGRLMIEGDGDSTATVDASERLVRFGAERMARTFEPPVSALGPLFQRRLNRVFRCQVVYVLDMNTRPTVRVLGGYYRKRRLVRVYTHDRETGRRPLEELFDTFLHEVAHHLEYTEPHSFQARSCGRVRGCMHSPLFWRILGQLKGDWAELQRRGAGGF